MLLISDENDQIVKQIMKDANKPETDQILIVNDISNQENEFHKKLKEKRSKKVQSWDIQLDKIIPVNLKNFNQKTSEDGIEKILLNQSTNYIFGGDNLSQNGTNIDNSDIVNKYNEGGTSPRGFYNESTPISKENIYDNSSIDILINSAKSKEIIHDTRHKKHLSMFILTDKVHDEV